jgi:hypothetical protein
MLDFDLYICIARNPNPNHRNVIASSRTIRNCLQINAFLIVRKLTMTDAEVIAGRQWGNVGKPH